ncbi:acyl-CoA desaturase [Methylophaga sp. OBS1]|uniref:acyl-CoA desaturase n=1 Tax=Methylophaga sp. OBS1 TaxID=2991933 RepID=UPI00224D9CC8|nr:acyl-CoA desaturase [Methylophaga sp. OBS1]MCX4190883.1 acyl-CoA desaturase [Methylophaga sp. OBS1]MCX4192170.1 acyl-CoA desaturase [Methylophaga sp. OBS1]
MRALRYWFDSNLQQQDSDADHAGIDWLRIIPFIGLHLGCIAVFWVGTSSIAVTTAIALYLLRMFAITAFYHRYFAHKSFKTSRAVQFLFALIGASATQRGPLWWAAHHRQHHRHADQEQDPHSPKQGFLWSHMGWFLSRKHFRADLSLVPELARYPELRWLDRYDIAVPVMLAVVLYAVGEALATAQPDLNTSGWQMVIWGYFISTVVLIHATLLINSLAHRVGRRRYQTQDDSRNNFLLALLTLGEGWHNNHHYHAASARQGFYWWEIDISYYLLWCMHKLGLIWDVRSISKSKRDARQTGRESVQ